MATGGRSGNDSSARPSQRAAWLGTIDVSGISGSGRPCRRTSTTAGECGAGYAIALATRASVGTAGVLASPMTAVSAESDSGTVPGVAQVGCSSPARGVRRGAPRAAGGRWTRSPRRVAARGRSTPPRTDGHLRRLIAVFVRHRTNTCNTASRRTPLSKNASGGCDRPAPSSCYPGVTPRQSQRNGTTRKSLDDWSRRTDLNRGPADYEDPKAQRIPRSGARKRNNDNEEMP